MGEETGLCALFLTRFSFYFNTQDGCNMLD